MRWVDGGLPQRLGAGRDSVANDVSSDGSVVVGDFIAGYRGYARRLRQKATSAVPAEQIRKAEAEVANFAEVLAIGALRASPTLAARFEEAERELTRLKAQEVRASVPASTVVLPDIANRYRRLTRDLIRSLHPTDMDRARIEIGRLLGPVKVEPNDTEIRLYNEQGRLEAALLRAVGSDATASFCGSGGLLPIQAIPLLRNTPVTLSMI